jgi:hypothetical protein
MIDAASLSPISPDAVPFLFGGGILLVFIGMRLNVIQRRLPRAQAEQSAAVPYTPAQQPRQPAGLGAIAQSAQRQAAAQAGAGQSPFADDELPVPSQPLEGPLPQAPRAQEPDMASVTLAAGAAWLHFNRLRNHAKVRLGERLAVLDRDAWLVERDVTLTNGLTIPYVLFGPTGIFAVAASTKWTIADLSILDDCARILNGVFPGYPDPVRGVICLPHDSGEARAWYDGQGRGGWIVGGPHLIALLEQFSDHGVAPADARALGQRAKPDITKPAVSPQLPGQLGRG